jgi:hypothetical protein
MDHPSYAENKKIDKAFVGTLFVTVFFNSRMEIRKLIPDLESTGSMKIVYRIVFDSVDQVFFAKHIDSESSTEVHLIEGKFMFFLKSGVKYGPGYMKLVILDADPEIETVRYSMFYGTFRL